MVVRHIQGTARAHRAGWPTDAAAVPACGHDSEANLLEPRAERLSLTMGASNCMLPMRSPSVPLSTALELGRRGCVALTLRKSIQPQVPG